MTADYPCGDGGAHSGLDGNHRVFLALGPKNSLIISTTFGERFVGWAGHAQR